MSHFETRGPGGRFYRRKEVLSDRKMGTHTFTFDQLDEAYDVLKNAAANEALKVVING